MGPLGLGGGQGLAASFVDYPLCLLFKNVSLRLNVKVDATTSKKKECKMRRIKRRNQVIKCLSEKS